MLKVSCLYELLSHLPVAARELTPGHVEAVEIKGSTPEAMAEAQAIIDAFDWSDEAQAARERDRAKAEAKQLLSGDSAQSRFNRAMVKFIAKLANRTPQQVVTVLVTDIEGEN